MSASGGDERMEEIRALFGKVWETLALPPPRFLRFESESETAARRRPRLTRDRRWGPDGRLVRWMHMRARVDAAKADRRSTPEDVERLERRLAFVRAAAAGTPPPLADGEAVDASIALLRRLERLCRDAGRVEELAVCLALRALLARGATGGSGRERPAHLELERLVYRQVVERTHAGGWSPGWDVSAVLEELGEFLRDPFLDEELRGWAAGLDRHEPEAAWEPPT